MIYRTTLRWTRSSKQTGRAKRATTQIGTGEQRARPLRAATSRLPPSVLARGGACMAAVVVSMNVDLCETGTRAVTSGRARRRPLPK